MRYTLLEMVQLILSAMDSEEINTIADTIESNQVALLLKSVYYDLAVDLQLPEISSLFELNASGDALKPVLMTVPSNVTRIDQIRYNNKLDTETFPNYVEVTYKPFNEFLDYTQGRRDQTSEIDSMSFTQNSETFETIFRTDTFPRFYTSTDDFTLVFDAYRSDLDTTLQKSKTLVAGAVYPDFELEDTFEPHLNPTQFSYFMNRAKVRAFAELKQAANQEAASETRIQKIRNQRQKRIVPNLKEHERLPNYGRT